MIVEIECLPTPPGTAAVEFEHVERAIAVIQQSGLKYEVGALGSTIEGDPDELWPLLRRVHEACLESGADSLVSIIKVGQRAVADDAPWMEGLTAPFRNGGPGS